MAETDIVFASLPPLEPLVDYENGRIAILWSEHSLRILVSRLQLNKSQDLIGWTEVRSWYHEAEKNGKVLHAAKLNFSSTLGKKQLTNALLDRAPMSPWAKIIEQLAEIVREKYEEGEPVEEITSDDPVSQAQYLIEPFLLLNQPNILFGEGGVGKSFLALVAASALSGDAVTVFTSKSDPVRTLYLDYEADRQAITKRLKKLSQGILVTAPHLAISYRRCTLPLSRDVEKLQRFIAEKEIKFVVIDSAGPACGGNLIEAEPVIQLFAALRQLNVTSLVIAHQAKNQEGRKSVFGSVYFTNLARYIWEMKKTQEIGEDEISVGLFHRKSNDTRLHKPLGFRIHWNCEKTQIMREDIAESETFQDELPLAERVLHALRAGKMTAKALAEDLGKKSDCIRTTLQRLKEKYLVVKTNDEWGLLKNE